MLLRIGRGDRHVGMVLIRGQNKNEFYLRVLAKLMADPGGSIREQRSAQTPPTLPAVAFRCDPLVAIALRNSKVAPAVVEQSRRNVAEGDDLELVVQQLQSWEVDDLMRETGESDQPDLGCPSSTGYGLLERPRRTRLRRLEGCASSIRWLTLRQGRRHSGGGNHSDQIRMTATVRALRLQLLPTLQRWRRQRKRADEMASRREHGGKSSQNFDRAGDSHVIELARYGPSKPVHTEHG